MLIRQRSLADSAFPPPLALSSSKMQWFSNQFTKLVHGGCEAAQKAHTGNRLTR